MKNIDVLKGALFLIMISLILLIGICDEDDGKITPTPEPTVTATPEPTPTACCPDESSLEEVYWDAKDEELKGEMTEVTLSSGGMDITDSGRCVAWEGSGMEVIIYAGGGADTDYCVDTETGMPVRTFHSEVTFSWQGTGYVDENNDRIFHLTPPEPGVYNVSVTAEDGGDCNAGPESESASCQIIVYRVQGLYGPLEVTRADTATYEVIVEGLSLISVWWYTIYNQVTNLSTQWSGIMVESTAVSCYVILECPFTQQNICVSADPLVTWCNNREWNIIVGACEESADPFPEDNETHLAYLCNEVPLGVHRDKETKTGYAFYPNDIEPGTQEPANTFERRIELVLRGVDIAQITDNGPNNGFWYIHDSSFKIDQEFVINKWIRPDGPNPPGADINWYNRNLQNCNDQFGYDNMGSGVGVAAWLQVIKDHENEGNHLSSNGYGAGHHAQMRREEEYFMDLKSKVEDNYSRDLGDVKYQTCSDFYTSENVVNGDPDHVYVEENWCPHVSMEAIVRQSTYDPDANEWKHCVDCKSTSNP